MTQFKSKCVEEAMDNVADAIRYGFKWLGTADAATPFGALEMHAMEIKNSGEAVSGALHEVATSLDNIADAIRELAASRDK